MEDGWKQVRKEVTCSICLTIFKEPKMLPCLHTFCAKCLQILWQADTESVGINKIIYCPQCREKVQLNSVEKLPSSFSISRLVDIVEMQDRLNKEAPPICQSCSSNTRAIASCTPCGIFLCTPCLDVHKTLKMTSSHQINSLDDIKSGKVTVPSILDHKQEMCSIHPDKPLEMYCKKDKCLICLGCAVVQHCDHKCDFIFQIAKEEKEKINLALPKVREQVGRVEQAAAKVKNMQDQLQERKQKSVHYVNEAFQEIIMALDERKQQLLDEINKTIAKKVQALNEQHKELTDLLAQMNGYLELMEVKLKSERDEAIIAMKEQMVNRGDALLKVTRLTKMSPIEKLPPKPEFPHLQNIKTLVKLLGMSLYSRLELFGLGGYGSGPKFKVTVKDSSGQPVLNCSSLLDVKIFPNENSVANVQQPRVTDKGSGYYEFSVGYFLKPYDPFHPAFKRVEQQQKYGSVFVQMFGKDIQGSPLRQVTAMYSLA